MDLILSTEDRRVLAGMLRATTISAGLVRRARVILALADGQSYAEIVATLGHLHALLWGTQRVEDSYVTRAWKLGRAEVKAYDPKRGAAWYLSETYGTGDHCLDTLNVSTRMPPLAGAFLTSYNTTRPHRA